MDQPTPSQNVPPSPPSGTQPPPTSPQGEGPIKEAAPDGTEKFLAAIGYVSFLCVLPLLLKKESKFCQYHGKQALVLAVWELIMRIFIVFTGFYLFLLFIYYLVVIYCVVRSAKGDYFYVPLISDIGKELKL